MQPQVTIILPVYNGERYLREAIDSVLAQTYRDFELWVCNDGSTDGSAAIVDSYADPRVRRIDNPQNMGLVATLNRAFAMVESPFIARMDDDDLWEPTKLEKQMALLMRRPDVGICGTSVHKFGDIEAVMHFPEESDALKVGLLFYCMMSHPSVIYRRSFLQQTGLAYRADYFPAEDYKMWVDALQHTHIYNLQESLVHYRQHSAQICRTKSSEQYDVERRIHEEQLNLIYPQASAEERRFHLDRFTSLSPQSDSDVEQFISWKETLCKANQQSRYAAPSTFRHELERYVCNAIRTYYIHTFRSAWHHIRSGRWHNLPIKHNLSILLHANRAQNT